MNTENQKPEPATRNLKPTDPAELPEVLDVAGAAALLGVSPNSIYYLVERRRIPCRRAGKAYRFLKSVLLQWLAGEPLAAAGKGA